MPAEEESSRQDFPERMAQWLHISDAITLRGAHQAIERVRVPAAVPGTAGAEAIQALPEALRQLRTTLTQTFGRELHQLLTESEATGGEPDPEVEFALHQQLFHDLQRRMELSVDALRHHVRETLAASGQARWVRLAALDATLDKMLGGREQELLGTAIPAVSRRRFDLLRREAREAREAAEAITQLDMIEQSRPKAPALSWLAQYSASLNAVLTAELEHRLQPVTGMVEATQVPTPTGTSPSAASGIA